MEPRERRALRVLAVTAAWVIGVPLGLVGAGAVVQQVQSFRQHGREDDRAHRALDRWAGVVAATATGARRFTPVGDLTDQEGSWEEGVGENDKIALLAGQVVVGTGAPLPPAPGTGTVRWADGATTSVPLMAPADAVRALREAVPPQARDCRGCRPLVVTGAELGTAQVDTDAGPATAPVWRFTIAGTGVRVTRVAVAPQAAATVGALGGSRGTDGLVAPQGWVAGADGRTLTVGFAGAVGPGSDPCGADYAGRVVESSTGVVVIVRQTSPGYWRQVARVGTLHTTYACPAVATFRTVDVRLGAPLRDRTVLDLVSGTPLRRGLPGPPG